MVKINKSTTQVIILFLVALLIRLIHLYLIKDSPLFENLLLDARHYDMWARDIIEKDWLGRHYVFMSPGYPYFLSLIYLIFGYSIKIVALIQLVIGSINCVLVYSLAKKIFANINLKYPDAFALCAAGLAVVYGVSIFYEGMLLKVALINLVNLLLLNTLLTGVEKTSLKHFLLSGLLLGLSTTLRPTIVLFVPFALYWLWKYIRIDMHRKLMLCAQFLMGLFIILAISGARNYLLSGELFFTTAHGGINLYIGNNPQAQGVYAPLSFFSPDTRHEHKDFVTEASRITGKQLSPMQSSKFWYKKASDFMLSNPLSWIKLLTKKFFIFWNAYESPINLGYHSFKNNFKLLKLPLLSFGIIAPFALLGILLLLRNTNEHVKLLMLYILSYLAGLVLFFISSEYRFPIIPILFVFASYSASWMFSQIKLRKYAHFAYSLIVLLLLFLLVNNTSYKIEVSKATMHNNIGSIYKRLGLYDEAILEFKAALFIKPDVAEIHYNIANAYVTIGNYAKAISEFKKAIEIKPDLLTAHSRLGELYVKAKQYEKAINTYKSILQFTPDSEYALNCLGYIYILLEDYKSTEYWSKKALEINPNSDSAKSNYAKIQKLLRKKK